MRTLAPLNCFIPSKYQPPLFEVKFEAQSTHCSLKFMPRVHNRNVFPTTERRSFKAGQSRRLLFGNTKFIAKKPTTTS